VTLERRIEDECGLALRRRVKRHEIQDAAIHAAADDMQYSIATAIAMAIDHRPSNLNLPKEEVSWWSFSIIEEFLPLWRTNGKRR